MTLLQNRSTPHGTISKGPYYQYLIYPDTFIYLDQHQNLDRGFGDAGRGWEAAVSAHPEGVLAGPGEGAAPEDVHRGDLHRELLHRHQMS